MRNPKNKAILLVVLINLIIATGFFIEHKDAGYTTLVSDVHSIVGIAQKFDNPSLFKDDLFLNDIDNVKYYTPFFVQPLRFIAKFTNHDYVQALNVTSFLLHLLFGILWFLLFFKMSKNIWLSLLMSILIRGVVWLPGYEIWGITGIWTTMPRTVYITLMPLFLLTLFYFREKKIWVSAFLVGLIFNFHPITGLGGILIYLTILGYFYFSGNVSIKQPFVKFGKLLFFIVLGMLPFILTYFGKTSAAIDYDIEIFQKALHKRLPARFFDPTFFLKKWLKFSTLAFILPLLGYFFYSFYKKSEFKKASLLVTLTLVLLVLPNCSVYLETAVNSIFDKNFRISFQFIRLQKLAVLPGYFSMAFLLIQLKNRQRVVPIFLFVVLLGVSLSNHTIFDKVPFLGDDIARTILPNVLNIYERPSKEVPEMEKMIHYIKNNTPKEAVLFAPEIIRSSTRRSVVLDYKGASALIEGNPKQFSKWYLERTYFENLKDEAQKISFLKEKKVSYIVSNKKEYTTLQLIKKIDNVRLYKL